MELSAKIKEVLDNRKESTAVEQSEADNESLKSDSIINLYNYKFYFFLRIKINLLH